VCDERGTTRWPSRTKTWALGGFIIESRKRQDLVSAWAKIKLQLCGNQDCELKWSHFFPGYHQKAADNPLLSNDPQEWRQEAKWALSELFSATHIFPVTIVVHKRRASDDVFVTTEDGRKVLDINTYWVGVLGQFALFLEEHNGGAGLARSARQSKRGESQASRLGRASRRRVASQTQTPSCTASNCTNFGILRLAD